MTSRIVHAHLERLAASFALAGEPEPLPGGTRTTFRVGDAVLKQIGETSLENDNSPALAAWIASFSDTLRQDGFRFPRARRTVEGAWITHDGFTAWEFLEGRHALSKDVPDVIEAAFDFHRALAPIERHPCLTANSTEWGRAEAACWGERPARVSAAISPLLDRLYDLRRPIETSPPQLIHGDLNPGNVLVADDAPPAFIDFAPFWAPVEFAVAMFANWVGPRRGDMDVLEHFRDVPHFDQLLIRAAIRMLLVMQQFSGWEHSTEKQAAELVLEYVENRVPAVRPSNRGRR